MRAAPLIALLVCVSGVAAAHPTGVQFDQDPLTQDGAGGVAFTGAPRFAGHACDVCHTDPPHKIGLRLEANPADVFATGYVAGATYQMRVVLLDEWAALDAAAAGDNCGIQTDPYQKCDDNGFALEIDDLDGKPQGTLAAAQLDGTCGGTTPLDADAAVLKDGTAVVENGAHHAQIAWTFCWTAPGAGTGALTAYTAVVDGNGGDGTVNFPNDTTGDDVFAGSVPILEKGSVNMPAQTGGCQAAPTTSAAWLTLLLLAPLAYFARRRRLWLLLLLVFSVGCVQVHSYQREDLAKRKMKFDSDENEAELDLHMQDAREGSSGGYGSAGGGCGCN